MGSLKNELSWSHSTAKVYEECPRKYWYKKFGGWNGWERGASEEKRQTWLLGKIQNRWMWRGDVIHDMIRSLITSWKRGTEVPFETLPEMVRERFRAGFRQSKKGLLLEGSSKATGLSEHIFDRDISNEDWKELVEGAVEMLSDFVKSDMAQTVKDVPSDKWLALENLTDRMIRGVKVYISMDAAWEEDDKALIIDWKTGKSEVNKEGLSDQLGLYSIFAEEDWGKAAVVREYLLRDGTFQEWETTEEQKENLRNRIERDVAKIRPFIQEGKNGIDADMKDFEPRPSKNACRHCNYFQLCPVANV